MTVVFLRDDPKQLPDCHLRMSPDEMHDPMMRPAEAVFIEDRVRLGGEIPVGEEQQLDAVLHLFLAGEGSVGGTGASG